MSTTTTTRRLGAGLLVVVMAACGAAAATGPAPRASVTDARGGAMTDRAKPSEEALRFAPLGQMEARGHGAHLPLFAASGGGGGAVAESGRRETAYLAGGCFWGVEELLRELPGVLETEAGYTGGITPNPRYPDVHAGATGHAEAVKIVFDPARISYEDLLVFFFKMHDPTTKNRQGNDVGTSYRSSIFFTSDEQRATAERVRARVDASKAWKRPVVTEIVAASEWYPAEEYHQDYLQKNPGGYTCHYVRDLEF